MLSGVVWVSSEPQSIALGSWENENFSLRLRIVGVRK